MSSSLNLSGCTRQSRENSHINMAPSFNKPFCQLTPALISWHLSSMSPKRIPWSATHSSRESLGPEMSWGHGELQNTSRAECHSLSELKEHAPPLLMLYDSKLISKPVGGKVHHEVKDGWKENGSQRTNGWVISRSDKPEGLITNIPHFRVSYNMEMQRGEY